MITQGKDVQQELAGSVVFPAHSSGTHRKHTGRWKQYSNRNFLGFFPYDFRPFPTGKHRQLAGIHRKKSEKLPTGILLPFPRNFRCFPTEYGDFSASFLQDPAGYGGRNLRPGYTYWIDDVNKSSSTILNEFLAYLSIKLKLELKTDSFYLTNTQRALISDCRLVLAGGDINKTKDIHKAFSLLNSININKEAIIGEDRNLDVMFLLNELLNRVIIFKSTYKGSVGESKRINTFFFVLNYFYR
jgi:hypothetical protein